MQRDDVPAFVIRTTGYAARWSTLEDSPFYYDGCERTLIVPDVPVRAQFKLLDDLEPHRALLESAAGGPIVTLFLRSKK